MLDGLEDLQGPVGLPHHPEGQGEFAAFAARHPRVGQHAAHPEAGDDETVPGFLHPLLGGRSGERAAEDRVVPVHRVAALVEEAFGVAADRVRERAGRQLPVRLRLLALLGDGECAAQCLVDGGAAGQQCVVDGGAVGFALPADLAAGLLEPQDEFDGRVHGRPHPVDEPVVAGGEVVVPDADGHVRAEVGLQAPVGRPVRVAVVVGGVPGAVLVLVPGQPLVRAFRGGVLSAASRAMAASVWSHGSRWWPRNQGSAPSSRWTASSAATVSVACSAVSTPGSTRCSVCSGVVTPRPSKGHSRQPQRPWAGAAWWRTRRSSCRRPG